MRPAELKPVVAGFVADYEYLLTEREELMRALRRYGDHHPMPYRDGARPCFQGIQDGGAFCECGWSEWEARLERGDER